MGLFPSSVGVIHFVGIGGIGMSGIAEILNNLGYTVQGSDIRESSITNRLERLGISVFYGHKVENVNNASVVVVSSSIKPDNCELCEARRLHIPVIKRAEMLGELMRLKKAVAVAGTHGKTTTTSLIANLFDCANLSPTVVNGGIINAYGSNARFGTGDWVIAEADESDGSFCKLFPTIAVVTNIDQDHIENFENFDDLRNRFVQFVEKIPFYGVGILCADNAEVRKAIKAITDKRIITYGFDESADVRGVNVSLHSNYAVFDVEFSQDFIDRYDTKKATNWKKLNVSMVGIHNVQNALAVVSVAVEMRIPLEVVRAALSSFAGVNRRFTKIGLFNGASVIDDYAHHPTEIMSVLKAARTVVEGKVFVVMQPHRYTRLSALMAEFADVLQNADYVCVLPVYSAGETPNGVSHCDLIRRLNIIGFDNVVAVENKEEIYNILKGKVSNGDIVLFLGAGDITYTAREFIKI